MQPLDSSKPRFDVRNLLDDRDNFRKVNYAMSVRPSEKEEERLCDIERYADVDSEEEMLWDYSEDERIAYVDEKRERRQIEAEEKLWKEALEASRPKPDFELHVSVPEEMITPLTRRQFAIIERTATFLNQSPATQNMEIVIQTKQSGNPDFAFLNTSDDLYPFYRHIRELMKAGEYVQLEVKGETKTEESEISQQGQTNNSVTPKKPTQVQAPYSGPIPPSETKVIVDKTATFVARAGPALEGRLRERNASNPRFNFLNPWNEYHAYWKSALQKAANEEQEKQTTGDNSEELKNQMTTNTALSVTETERSSSPCETIKPSPPLSPPTNLSTSSTTEALPSVLEDEAAPSPKVPSMAISTDKDSQARRRRRAEEFLAKRRREATLIPEDISKNVAPNQVAVSDQKDGNSGPAESNRTEIAGGQNSASSDKPSELKTAVPNATTTRHLEIPADVSRRAEALLAKRRREAAISENLAPTISVTGKALSPSSNETEVSLQAGAAPSEETSPITRPKMFLARVRGVLGNVEPSTSIAGKGSNTSDDEGKMVGIIEADSTTDYDQVATSGQKDGSAESKMREIDAGYMQRNSAPPDKMKKGLPNATTTRHEEFQSNVTKPNTETEKYPSANSDQSPSNSLSRDVSNRKRSRQDIPKKDSDDSDSRLRRHHHRSKEEEPRKHRRQRSCSKSKSPPDKRRSHHHRSLQNDRRSVTSSSDDEANVERKRRKNRNTSRSDGRRLCDGSEDRRGRDRESKGHSSRRKEGSRRRDKEGSDNKIYRERYRE